MDQLYVVRGNGITEKLVIAPPQNDKEAVARLRYLANNPFDWVDEIERQAHTILADYGHSYLDETSLPEDTSQDFARRILQNIRRFRRAIKCMDVAVIARAVFEIGCLVREHDIKQDWEKEALAGRHSREGARKGGEASSAVRHQALLRRDKEFAQLYLAQKKSSRLSASALKAKIGRKHKCRLGRSASITAVDRGLKILSGERAGPDN